MAAGVQILHDRVIPSSLQSPEMSNPRPSFRSTAGCRHAPLQACSSAEAGDLWAGCRRGRPGIWSPGLPRLWVQPCGQRAPPRVCADREVRAEARFRREGTVRLLRHGMAGHLTAFLLFTLVVRRTPRAIPTTNPDGLQGRSRRRERLECRPGGASKPGPADATRNLKGWRRGLPAPLPSKHPERCFLSKSATHTHQPEARELAAGRSCVQKTGLPGGPAKEDEALGLLKRPSGPANPPTWQQHPSLERSQSDWRCRGSAQARSRG